MVEWSITAVLKVYQPFHAKPLHPFIFLAFRYLGSILRDAFSLHFSRNLNFLAIFVILATQKGFELKYLSHNLIPMQVYRSGHNELALKACLRAILTGVRIPPPAPKPWFLPRFFLILKWHPTHLHSSIFPNHLNASIYSRWYSYPNAQAKPE